MLLQNRVQVLSLIPIRVYDCIYRTRKDEIINVTEGTNAEEYILYDIKGIAVKNGKIDAAQTCVNVQTLNSGIYAINQDIRWCCQ